MSEPNNNPRICVNGHQSRDAAARFCITCGTPLNGTATAPAPQVQQQPSQTPPMQVAPPVQQFQQPLPVNQYSPQNYPPQANQYPPPNYPLANGNQMPQGNGGYYSQPQPLPPNFNQYPPQQQQYPPQQQYFQPAPQIRPIQCQKCGDDGSRLPEKVFICPECRWLRPLAPGYAIDCAAFQWAEDGKAMSALRSISALNTAAKAISSRVGRRWIEVTFNGVLLSEKQLPDIYFQAVRAARILGMSHMPDVYVSGERPWDCHTYGSDNDAFIVIGSALASSFRGADLSFLLAREMGHVRAGHALWKTVSRFLVGEQARGNAMSNGVLGFLSLSPTALIESAIETPLMAWARQAEITADRAGLLAVGDEEVARRVLLSWSLKSAFLYNRINVAAWLEQQASSDDGAMKLSEMMTTSTPYITRRLSLTMQFARSEELKRWRSLISQFAPPLPTAPPKPGQPKHPANANQKPPTAATKTGVSGVEPQKNALETKTASGEIKMKCTACNAQMRIPRAAIEGKPQINVRCPKTECGKIMTLKLKPASAPVRRDEEANFTD